MTKKQLEEYIKCREDPVYFLKKYGKVRHPTKGLLRFNLWEFQEKSLEAFVNNSYNIILKARQLGLSTLCAGYITWMVTFYRDKQIYILATKSETATNLITKVKTFIENLPQWIRPEFRIDNRQSFELKNGSTVKASATTTDAARSEALSLLIIDEAAFIDKMDDIWVAAQPTLSTGGDCIALSSPNGIGNWFHKMYQKALAGEGLQVGSKEVSFNPIKLHWTLHPDRSEKWAVATKKEIGTRGFAQEHDCDFLQSGANVIDMDDILYYTKNPIDRPHIQPPMDKIWMDRNLWIWEYPRPGANYHIAADVARGDGSDYSAFHVVDVEKYEQVAEYKGKIPTDVFAKLLVDQANMYNGAFLSVENNSVGWHVAKSVVEEHEYKNVYWTIKDTTRMNESNIHQFQIDPYNIPNNAVHGFTMSSKTRPAAIARMEEDIRMKSFVFHSQRLFDEFQVFVFVNGKPQAMDGYNDDLVISLSQLMYLRHIHMGIFGTGEEATGAMIDSLGYTTQEYQHGILTSNDQPGDDKTHESYFVALGPPDQPKEDLSWLLG